jgi:polyisoprenoid-binding protein YceI
MTRNAALAACCTLSLSVASVARASDWTLDPSRSQARFAISNLLVLKVRGTLGTVTGRLHLDDKDVTRSRITGAIALARIDTGDAKRDEHLRSKDFFEVATYPVATFSSTKVEAAGGGALRVTGELSVHGITRTVVLDLALGGQKTGATELTAKATTRIDRHDLGLNSGSGFTIGSEAALELEVTATPADAPTPAR